MLKKILLVAYVLHSSINSFAQTFDSLKLTDPEIPSYYSQSKKLLCQEEFVCNTYSKPKLYIHLFDDLVKKDFQSFESRGDNGTILYFEFSSPFTNYSLLETILWGNHHKYQTKSNPHDYYVKGKILVIWSFKLESEIKDISKAKVISVLNK